MSDKRLIEVAFPLEQTSLDSVHEKNVRHGHISTLHIWPARRPLAACRAALIATLLPDPGDKAKRDEILDRLGGKVSKTLKKKTMPSGKVEDIEANETVGGILHWGRESGPDLDWFRQEIRKAYGGRAPKVLDPFAGGGAIPLEALRLGCDVTAVDINPVAWFILKCTLEYPQKFARQIHRLPAFVLTEPAFMETYIKSRLPEYLRGKGVKESDIKKTVEKFSRSILDPAQTEFLKSITSDTSFLESELAWHVLAWGYWVLRQARKELAPYYPTYAEFCNIKPYARVPLARQDDDQLKLVSINEVGEPQAEILNAGFDQAHLKNDSNPRWIAKPTVAYLWARTVKCKACRATVPLLKTRWLAKKGSKRVLLTMEPLADKSEVRFSIDHDVKIQGGNPAQRREYDKRISIGTMSRSGAGCPMPTCGTTMTMEDIRLEGLAGRLGAVLTSVVVDGLAGKEYRLPTLLERTCQDSMKPLVEDLFSQLRFGAPTEALAANRQKGNSGFRVLLYGLTRWRDLFDTRQLISLGTLSLATTKIKDQAISQGYSREYAEALQSYAALAVDKVADSISTLAHWQFGNEFNVGTFQRFALPISWDYSEINPLSSTTGSYQNAIDWVTLVVQHIQKFGRENSSVPEVIHSSVLDQAECEVYDAIITDPPYYDAIAYSDVMDFFHTWLRRSTGGLETAFAFENSSSPKWSKEQANGELIDDPSRFDGDTKASKSAYENGMSKAFSYCHRALKQDGRLVIVFAHKHPSAWETLVAAIIQAGFTVDASWPIQTERVARTNAISSASLASSVWLICRKRDPSTRAGWDADVLKEMEANIKLRLRDFWDAGIHGPDFVWSATGPALESYSRYPAIKKATQAGELMTVAEFLRHVRRIVVDFVVGRVLTGGDSATDGIDVSLDDVSTYYLLHRNDFGLKDAPAGACILYAVSCGLSEGVLAEQHDILSRGKGVAIEGIADDEDGERVSNDGNDDESVSSGGQFRLKAWSQRKNKNLGVDPGNGRPVPLIDQIHKVMQLWKAGDENKVNDYLDQRGLRRSGVFAQLLQALIEKSRSEGQTEECAILEKLSNHLRKIGAMAQGALSLNS